MTADGRTGRRFRSLLIAAAALTALALALRWAQTPPEGPVDPTWSRTLCAHCGMLVGERAFAAQLHTETGALQFFDDPGCLLLHGAAHPGDDARVWFHHLREARWIPAASVGFVPAEGSPMGYGVAAVDAGEPGAISRAAALAIVRSVETARAGAVR